MYVSSPCMTKTESAALISRRRLSEDLLRSRRAENFACETFSFRMSSAKPLKTFWFSRLRNFRFRGFQCYQSLAADFVSRSFLRDVFQSLGGGRSRSFLYRTFHVILSFLENQIPIMSPSGLEHLPRRPRKTTSSSGFRRRSACATSSRASAPPSVIIPRTAALDAGSSPCMTKLKAQRLFLGSHFLPRALWAANPHGSGHAVSILYARQLAGAVAPTSDHSDHNLFQSR